MFTVALESREVSTEGVIDSNAFTIKANGKAFKVLIDGLYSDKVRSIIRELWSNAYDSHAQAGKADEPFDCQLPTWAEPAFRVRDYGVSLTHEGVMKLYTTVFESTKEDTNVQVGKLGLGSKSPFAYTDTFTVTAWKDGEQRVYSAYIGSDHIPMISLLGREPSSEPQGLEVSFPVAIGDFDSFKVAAARVLLGFDVKPNISGTSMSELEEECDLGDVLFSGVGWRLHNNNDIAAQAKQGCVVYPIDPQAVTGATQLQRDILNSAVFIDFEIGELEIAASREGLGYDAATCANIIKRVSAIEAELTDRLTSGIATCTTRWEVAKHVKALEDSSMPCFMKNLLSDSTWRGQPVSSSYYVASSTVFKIQAEIASGFRKRRNGTGWDGDSHGVYVRPDRSRVYFQDTSKKITRIRDRLKLDYETHVMTSSQHHSERPHIILIKGVPGSYKLKRDLVMCGRPSEIIDVASLPVPPKTDTTPRAKIKVKELNLSGHSVKWREVDVASDDGGIYVEMSRFDIIGPTGKSYYIGSLRRTVEALFHLGVIPAGTPIYGVPRTLKRMVNNTKWQKLWDLHRQAIDIFFDPHKIGRRKAVAHRLDEIGNDGIGEFIKKLHSYQSVRPDRADHPAGELFHRYADLALEATVLEDYDRVDTLIYTWPESLEDLDPIPCYMPSLLDLVEQCQQRYPLLQDVTHCCDLNADRMIYLLDYINLVDTSVSFADSL